MKLVLIVASIFIFNVAQAQLAPAGEFKTNYTKELNRFEANLKSGKQMEAENSFQMLLQLQQRHKKQLQGLLANATDKEEQAEIASRIEDEEERMVRVKELALDMAGNKQEILEEMQAFLEE